MANAAKQQSGKPPQGARGSPQALREGARRAMDQTVEQSKGTLEKMGVALKSPKTAGAAVAGAAVIGAGTLFGWGSAGVGAITGYAAYRMAKARQAS
jgi:hypothetical protein